MADTINSAVLSQTWVHSHEEDSADKMVFRPSSYRFPPSRGRKSFQLQANGTLVSSGPGPDDRTTSATGVWKLEDADRLTLQPAGAAKTSMKILSAEPDRLVVKKD
jgi:hypothetical protein